MTDPQPPTLTPGPTPTGDISDELRPASAEDRKAAAALSSLDTPRDDDNGGGGKQNVDVEAVRKAMDRLGEGGARGKEGEGVGRKKEEVKRVVKVEAGDVKVVIEELELSKPKATELLKANDGDLVKALRAFVAV
ncbi:hypothetical protein VC83_06071 [Pseudogymnoascus destructans]|uniref:Nascent polypeptide-associated complex subunit alpha-like UBA domain-containing protein n=2 Tax=Pseudogymnoascus destructans TaxID=655981 RepID=L8FSL6_PSED2|nr:uncharacterized protein VC83_06071 [Pseudogymnoascus destructans]ELR03867.1 hypothetical protein GMDG_06407 [Pseudogymnoascus destructans 20631-21]OAF58944.1 hypothetical protein VC83_06071 [Pseudogymnoascus destructans]